MLAISGGQVGDAVPLREGLDTMEAPGECVVTGGGWGGEITDGGEDGHEALTAALMTGISA